MKNNFNDLALVLRNKVPSRPVLFEFFLNEPLYRRLSSINNPQQSYTFGECSPMMISAFTNAGYDYATVLGSDFKFLNQEKQIEHSISLNAYNSIRDRDSFRKFSWADPESFDYSRLEIASSFLPSGMKLVVCGPGGVLENVISLIGYDRLCYMLTDEPDLVRAVFDEVGERLVTYYQICLKYSTVGAIISNDDWGFKTQTLLPPDILRKYVFPWHRKIVETAHAHGRPAILHSCGQLVEVMDDIIEDMEYDAKHSYEDAIIPVEQAYALWGKRIAILGGVDLDFICRSTPLQITQRCKAMLALSEKEGGYALGTGNSVPEYVPYENYQAMISTINQKSV